METIKRYEVAGIPIAGVLVAACGVFVAQWLWWGSLWNGSWPELNSVTEADLEVPYRWWAVGLAVIAAQGVGVAAVLKSRGWPRLVNAMRDMTVLGVLLAVPLGAYPLLYLPEHSWKLFGIDSASYFIGWVLSAAVITAMKSRPSDPSVSVHQSHEATAITQEAELVRF